MSPLWAELKDGEKGEPQCAGERGNPTPLFFYILSIYRDIIRSGEWDSLTFYRTRELITNTYTFKYLAIHIG